MPNGNQIKQRTEFKDALQRLIDKHLPSSLRGAPVLVPQWDRRGGSSSDDNRLTLNEALVFLMTACFILIGGMSARRKEEMNSLQSGCAYQDAFGRWWLTSYIEKTLRDIDSILSTAEQFQASVAA